MSRIVFVQYSPDCSKEELNEFRNPSEKLHVAIVGFAESMEADISKISSNILTLPKCFIIACFEDDLELA